MMNGLVGVLSIFRKDETAVTCDIEQMIHSLHVNREHKDFLRFLWDNPIQTGGAESARAEFERL